MTRSPTKYSFFKKEDSVFEESPQKPAGKITTPNVLPNHFLETNFNFKSSIFDTRLTNIGYLRSLISSNDKSQIQPVIKIISTANHVRGVKAAVNYIARFAGLKQQDENHKDTKLYNQDGLEIKNEVEATKIIKEWSKDFKKDQNIMSHMIFSVGGGEEKNKNRSFMATKKFLEDNFKSRGYDYFMAPHYDTKNHHIHVVIKKKNKLNENLRLDKHDLFILRDLYAKNLTAFGIKRSSAARLDKKEVLDNIEKKIAVLKEQNSHYQSKLTKDSSQNFNAYVYKAKVAGKLESIIKEIKYNKEKNPEINFLDKTKLNNNLKDLKDFKKTIIHGTSKEEIKKAIELTKSHFERENQVIAKKIDNFINQDENVKFAYLKPKKQGAYLKLIIKKQIEEINKAKGQLNMDLKNNKFNLEERQVVKEAFTYFDMIVSKARILEKGLKI